MKRDLIWLTAVAMSAFVVLAGLGVWQLKRLAWKEGLIARIEARVDAAPVSLDEAMARWRKSGEVEYLRVRLEGSFRHYAERYLFTVFKGQAGWRVVTPLNTPSGRVVMVDRGFVPDTFKQPQTRKKGLMPSDVSVTGLARASARQGLFTPDNTPDKNIWYWRDLQGMAASALSRKELERLVPFFVELEANSTPGGWPKGGVTRIALPNNHLQYALTWFSLAGALLAVFAIAVRGRLRRRPFT